jgi:ribonuclease Z
MDRDIPLYGFTFHTVYDGPLTLAQDYLVWNVTKDKITTRTIAYNKNAWPSPAPRAP